MEQVYPTYYPCTTPEEWKELNDQASKQLGYADENADTYSMPIIDKNKTHHFIVNQEVANLVDLEKCIEFEQIQLNTEL
jgi:hypothetical protein